MHSSDMFPDKEASGAATCRPTVDWNPGPALGSLRGILQVLRDQRVRLRIDGGRPPGETRRFHKHAVARRAAEVHSALDSPVVLPCRGIIHWVLLLHNILDYLKKTKENTGFLQICCTLLLLIFGFFRDSPTARSSFTPIQIPLANSTPPT